jgi:hypothetical protein
MILALQKRLRDLVLAIPELTTLGDVDVPTYDGEGNVVSTATVQIPPAECLIEDKQAVAYLLSNKLKSLTGPLVLILSDGGEASQNSPRDIISTERFNVVLSVRPLFLPNSVLPLELLDALILGIHGQPIFPEVPRQTFYFNQWSAADSGPGLAAYTANFSALVVRKKNTTATPPTDTP